MFYCKIIFAALFSVIYADGLNFPWTNAFPGFTTYTAEQYGARAASRTELPSTMSRVVVVQAPPRVIYVDRPIPRQIRTPIYVLVDRSFLRPSIDNYGETFPSALGPSNAYLPGSSLFGSPNSPMVMSASSSFPELDNNPRTRGAASSSVNNNNPLLSSLLNPSSAFESPSSTTDGEPTFGPIRMNSNNNNNNGNDNGFGMLPNRRMVASRF